MIHSKVNTVLLLLIAFCITAMQQPKTYPVQRLYGYKQQILKGVKPKTKKALSEKQFIYLLIKQHVKIEIFHVWLNGSEMDFSVQDATAPVVLGIEKTNLTQTKPLILVPKKEGLLQQVVLSGIKQSTSRVIPSHMKTFELLIAYRHSGKVYFLGSKKLKSLPTEINP